MTDETKTPFASPGGGADEILNIHGEIARRQGPLGTIVDRLGHVLAHPILILVLFGVHLGWVVANLPGLPWEPWDPYPFTFLATVASVEAPFIALLVLMYQKRMQRIAELREEVNLQVSLHIDKKASRALRMLDDLEKRSGVEADREGLDQLEEDVDPKRIMEHVERELEESEGEKEI